MFIGHIAVGFASKALAPRTSLGVLIAAPVFADLIWPIFLSLGWEHVRIDPLHPRTGSTIFFHRGREVDGRFYGRSQADESGGSGLILLGSGTLRTH